MKLAEFHTLKTLIIVLGLEGCFHGLALWGQEGGAEDSIRVEELLIIDTLDLDIKGPSNDVAFYRNGLVFLSNTKYHQEMLPDHITFGQITSFITPLEYISLESSKPLFSNDPFPYPPGGTCYSRDFQTVYFTKKTEIPGNRYPEKIFEMDIVEGKATVYNQLPFTAGPVRYMHPALSANGDFMILASDLSPSNGGLDLFIVRKGVSGWLTPVNMGPEINTSGHEWFPYLDQHNNLYFSSSGHMGFGGYDLYVCFFNGNDWGPPQNLTELFNTPKDELAFSIHPDRRMAAYSIDDPENEEENVVMRIDLNNSAFVMAGLGSGNQDISLLVEDLLRSGYTKARFGSASEKEVKAGYNLTSLPLLTEEEPVESPEEETESSPPVEEPTPAQVQTVQETEPVLIVEEEETEPETEPVLETPQPEPEQAVPSKPEPNPNQVVFRVQILSNSKPGTRPSVTIAGKTYATWEYQYKGAYRITVGEFTSVQEASAFGKKCRSSGFNQAFVAAFRGNERETDPSVFRK